MAHAQPFFAHSLSLTLSLSHSLSSAAYAPSFPLSIKDVLCKNWSSLNKRISLNVVQIALQNFIFPILILHQMPHIIFCFFPNDFDRLTYTRCHFWRKNIISCSFTLITYEWVFCYSCDAVTVIKMTLSLTTFSIMICIPVKNVTYIKTTLCTHSMLRILYADNHYAENCLP